MSPSAPLPSLGPSLTGRPASLGGGGTEPLRSRFAGMRHQMAGAAAGDAKPKSYGEERTMRLAKFRTPKPVGNSAPHQGVVARPMDQQLSDILDKKRAQVLGRGTSVARLGREAAAETNAGAVSPDAEATLDDEEEGSDLPPEQAAMVSANSRTARATRGVSVARLATPKVQMGLQDMPVEALRQKEKPSEPTDLPI